MNVVDLMSKLLLKVTPDAPLRHVNQLLHLYKVNGLVVAEGDKPVGVVTYSDLFRAFLPSYKEVQQDREKFLEPKTIDEQMRQVLNMPVKTVMTRELITVPPDMSAIEAGAMMNAHKVKQLPVVEDGKLIGIVSHFDITWALIMRACKLF